QAVQSFPTRRSSDLNKYVYVIHEYIPILLNDTDQDLTHLNSIAQQLIKQLPNELANALQNTLNRITAQHKSADGEWNREEMKYYDAAVDTEKQRLDMLKSIKTDNLWRLFIPRKQNMI